jgi:cytochrome c oxidase subunit II
MRVAVAILLAFAGAPPSAAQLPMNYFVPHGAMAGRIQPLLMALLIVSIVVVVVVAALVGIGAWRGRSALPLSAIPLSDSQQTRWIYVGVGASTLVLIGLIVWTSLVMARIANPPTTPALTIAVNGHQWWWEAIYQNDDPSQVFKTANEIHIPVGQPVRITLDSTDVIHSFWVPALAGKTDVIPGQTNITWLEADRAGIYRGQCSEYCGQQHAHMAFAVHADPPQEFERWRLAQLEPAPVPQTAELQDGENRFVLRCGPCHGVRGSRAGGMLGPNLSHLLSRDRIAAETAPNNDGYRAAWIADPQRLKPGALMPELDLTGEDLYHIDSFLKTLK